MLLIVSLAGPTPQSQDSQLKEYGPGVPYGGFIEGAGVDEDNKPVARAKVYAEVLNFVKGLIPTTKTNKDGLFRMFVPVGTYNVYAGKKSEGYPESLCGFYGDRRALVVTVSKDITTHRAFLQLDEKLGRLVGKVTDDSGRSISLASITLRHESKIVNFRFHDLRHTAATRFADGGADAFTIAAILSHATIQMSARYVHGTDEGTRRAVDNLVDFGNPGHKSVTKQKRQTLRSAVNG